MPGPKAEKIELSDGARQALEKWVARHTTGQHQAQRARIVLKAAEGKNPTEELKVGVDMARLWRRRWIDLQGVALDDLSVAERLADWPRPGAPAQRTADQLCQMEQMACPAPEKAGRPISQWTGREKADELVKRGSVNRISPRHAARLLKKGVSNRTCDRRSPCATI